MSAPMREAYSRDDAGRLVRPDGSVINCQTCEHIIDELNLIAAERGELREIAALWNAGCGCSAEEHAKLAAERDEWKRRAEALGYQGGK